MITLPRLGGAFPAGGDEGGSARAPARLTGGGPQHRAREPLADTRASTRVGTRFLRDL